MRNMTDPPVESDEKDGIACTEIEPSDLFRTAGSSRESPDRCIDFRAAGLRLDAVTNNEPSSQYLTAQIITSERVLLPDVSTVSKVMLTDHSDNGSL